MELQENPLLEEAPADEQPATDAELETPEPGDLALRRCRGAVRPAGRPRPRRARSTFRAGSSGTPTSLADHLGEQLRLMTVEPAVRIAAEEIIGNVDDDGYLQTTVEEIADRRAIPSPSWKPALRVVQEFDPGGVAGVAAATSESASSTSSATRPAAPPILSPSRWSSATSRPWQEARYPENTRALSVGLERVMERVQRISALESKPGRRFAPVETHYVVPDVLGEEVRRRLRDHPERGRHAPAPDQLVQPERHRAGGRGAAVRRGPPAVRRLADQEHPAAPGRSCTRSRTPSSSSSARSWTRGSRTSGRCPSATWPRTSACTSRR